MESIVGGYISGGVMLLSLIVIIGVIYEFLSELDFIGSLIGLGLGGLAISDNYINTYITIGKYYRILEELDVNYKITCILIIDDIGNEEEYLAGDFELANSKAAKVLFGDGGS